MDSSSSSSSSSDANMVLTALNEDVLTTFVAGSINGGSGYINGPSSEARFNEPRGIAIDSEGNIIVADTDNHCLRKIDRVTRKVETYAGIKDKGSTDGPRTEARFNRPMGLYYDKEGNLLVADYLNSKIRRVSPEGIVQTVAGTADGHCDGPVSEARFNNPTWVDMDSEGNIIVADWENNRIRCIDKTLTSVSTLAGDGSYGHSDGDHKSAKFNRPFGVAVDSRGDIFITDQLNGQLRKLSNNKVITSLKLRGPRGIIFDKDGNLIIAEGDGNRIRRLCFNKNTIETIAVTEKLSTPRAIALDKNENIYIANTEKHNILKLSFISILANTWPRSHSDLSTDLQERVTNTFLLFYLVIPLMRDLRPLLIKHLIWIECTLAAKNKKKKNLPHT